MIDPFSLFVGMAVAACIVLAAAIWHTIRPEPQAPADGPEPPPEWNGLDYCAHPTHDPRTPVPALYEQRDVTPVADLDQDGEGGTWAAITWCADHAPAGSRPIA